MNIWLISLFDPTPLDEPIYPRFIEIAKAALRAGHEVTHFTSTFRHTTKAHRFEQSREIEIEAGYRLVLTRSMGYRQNISLKRFVAHLDYARKLVDAMDKMAAPEVIFMSMPPLSTVEVVSRWAQNRNIPVVIDIIDPWPDSFIKDVPRFMRPADKVLLTPFYQKLKRAFKRASAITAISNGYLKWAAPYHAADKPTRPYFLAIDLEAVQSEIGQAKAAKTADAPLRLIYAGSLASSYDIPSILSAAKRLEQSHPGQTQFVITGKGPQLGLIEAAAKEAANIRYLGWLSREELIRQYALADVGLIQHKNSLTQTITYKFFNYMSAGMALLNSLQTEMAEMIDAHQLGMNNREEDAEQLAANVRQYLHNPELLRQHQQNALAFTAEYGDTQRVYGKLVAFLEETAQTGKA